MRRRLELMLSFGVLLGAIVGCGGAPEGPVRNYADVTGKVSYKGVPLKMGTVMFQPASGPFASGEIQPDGTYRLKGEIGPNTVTITSRDAPPANLPTDPVQRNSIAPPKSHIPEFYGDRRSGLKFDVQKQGNQANFELK